MSFDKYQCNVNTGIKCNGISMFDIVKTEVQELRIISKITFCLYELFEEWDQVCKVV